jgi:hypothetical protein
MVTVLTTVTSLLLPMRYWVLEYMQEEEKRTLGVGISRGVVYYGTVHRIQNTQCGTRIGKAWFWFSTVGFNIRING